MAAQRREQEDVIRQKKKAYDEEMANAKNALELQEIEVHDRLESITKREAELAVNEASLAENSARLVEREANAERGFLVEKVRILKPIEYEVNHLRNERDRLEKELVSHGEMVEEELREKAAARSVKWAEERRLFDEDLAHLRHEKLESLRATLATEREITEESWRREFERRSSSLDAKESALDERQKELTDKFKEQRAMTLDLQAERELLDEDRQGYERKVNRLVTERTENLRFEADGLKKLLEDARNAREAYWNDLESRKELDRRFGNHTAEEILSALTVAENDRDTFAHQLRERPDTRTAERLAQLERER